MSCPMAFMCRSAGVQRWSARVGKDPLFQPPTVSGNCKGASPHTSAHFHLLHYHKMCVLTRLYSNATLLDMHVCKRAQRYNVC